MAKEPEPAEDLPTPKEEGAQPSKTIDGKTSFIPAIITIIAVPLIMILIWEVYMMPSLRKLAKEHAATPAVAEEGSAAEPLESTAVPEAQPASEEEKKSKGKEAETEGTYEFKDIVANLSGAMRSRYIKVSFTLEGKSADFAGLMKGNEAKIRDATLAVLSDLTIQDLEEPGVKNIIRNNILSSINQALNTTAVEQLYFSEFVVQ
jgi:flagellar protein FliL